MGVFITKYFFGRSKIVGTLCALTSALLVMIGCGKDMTDAQAKTKVQGQPSLLVEKRNKGLDRNANIESVKG